jgi:hypothetical protein
MLIETTLSRGVLTHLPVLPAQVGHTTCGTCRFAEPSRIEGYGPPLLFCKSLKTKDKDSLVVGFVSAAAPACAHHLRTVNKHKNPLDIHTDY